MTRWFGRIWSAMLAAAPVRVWATIAAGPLTLAFAAGLALIIWKGGWPVDRAEQQLALLGTLALSAMGLQLVVLISMSGVQLNFKASRSGVEAGLDRDNEDAPKALAVTTTTTTEVQTPPKVEDKSGDGELPPDQRVKP